MKSIYSFFFIITITVSIFTLCSEELQLEKDIETIAHNLRCPVCQGLSVKESQTGISLNMKLVIKDLLQRGYSHEEIFVYFKERYGEWILRTPLKQGFNLFLWILPIIIIVGAVFSLLFFLLKQKKFNQPDIPSVSSEDKKFF